MSYSSFFDHQPMVFDEIRNTAYATAIREAITPDSVVLDLGAGLGILGLIAAKAGARKVYLVEPNPIVKVAKEIAEANGLADRIVVLEGKVEEIELPEKVDLILSVFTGNLLFSEDLLPSLYFARDRFLNSGGTMIPNLAELMVAPISAFEFYDKYLDCWSRKTSDIDCSVARRFASNEIFWLGHDVLDVDLIAAGQFIQRLDLSLSSQIDCDGHISTIAERAGTCHGLLCWIRLKIGEDWISSGPGTDKLHWTPATLFLESPIEINKGQQMDISLNRPARGDWTWSLSTNGHRARHSTFLSHVDTLGYLKKNSENSVPRLSGDGLAALHIMQLINDGKSLGEIADILISLSSDTYPDRDTTLQLVRSIVRRYAQ